MDHIGTTPPDLISNHNLGSARCFPLDSNAAPHRSWYFGDFNRCCCSLLLDFSKIFSAST
uniref:Uncharacterized protein n=1 Tax=Salix viminalis TaxID=40686 RepID=A0A6N2K2P1_SALVM